MSTSRHNFYLFILLYLIESNWYRSIIVGNQQREINGGFSLQRISDIVSCFPQMKPETRVKSESEEPSPAKASEDVAVDSEFSVDLTDEEKLVLDLLKNTSPIDLNALKFQAALSNKKWDLAIKGLRKHNLARVKKSEEGLMVELV